MFKLNSEGVEFIKNNEHKIREYLGKNGDCYISIWTIKPEYNLTSAMGGVFWFGYRDCFFLMFIVFFLSTIVDLILLLLNYLI